MSQFSEEDEDGWLSFVDFTFWNIRFVEWSKVDISRSTFLYGPVAPRVIATSQIGHIDSVLSEIRGRDLKLSEGSLEGKHVDCDYSRGKFKNCAISGRFERCTFDGSRFQGCSFFPTKFVDCSFVNCDWTSPKAYDTEFVRCRFDGFRMKGGSIARSRFVGGNFDRSLLDNVIDDGVRISAE